MTADMLPGSREPKPFLPETVVLCILVGIVVPIYGFSVAWCWNPLRPSDGRCAGRAVGAGVDDLHRRACGRVRHVPRCADVAGRVRHLACCATLAWLAVGAALWDRHGRIAGPSCGVFPDRRCPRLGHRPWGLHLLPLLRAALGVYGLPHDLHRRPASAERGAGVGTARGGTRGLWEPGRCAARTGPFTR